MASDLMDDESYPSEDKPVAAAERLISILDAFVGAQSRLSLAELSRRTKLYKSTILRLLSTLLSHGYLTRTEAGEYAVGPVILRLASSFQNALQPQDIILPVLRRLVDQTGESASYVVPRGNVRMCLYRVDSMQVLRDHGSPGDVAPLDRGSAGLILSAFSNPNDAGSKSIRERMVALTHGEIHKGMAGMAAPVFDRNGEVSGVVALSGPEARFDAAAIAKMERVLIDGARTLTERIGGDPKAFDARRKPRSRPA